METLTGPQIGQLRDLLKKAFNPNDFRQLVRTQMNVQFAADYEPSGTPFKDALYNFIDDMDKQGRLADLIQAVLKAREERADFKPAIDAIFTTHASSPSTLDLRHSSFSVPSNLPGGYIGRLFLGRDAFLDQLRVSLLKQTHATAITQDSQNPKSEIRNPKSGSAATGIAGLGGIGKTHAAVAYADRHRGDYSALLFVSGDSPEKLNASLAALCGVLQLDAKGALPPDEPARVAAAVHWLASHRDWLLIVDNVDTQEAAAALTALLANLTTGHVLITSRLHGWADNVEALDLEVLSSDFATELLLQLTDKGRRHAVDDPAQARLLADLLEGLPLALHQAAGYINEQRLHLADYLALYHDEAAELLNWFDHLRIPYERPDKIAPRPVLITWKTSFERLDPDTRRWLLVFAHFAPEPIPEFLLDTASDAAAEVNTRHRAALKALAQAEKYCLLTRHDTPPHPASSSTASSSTSPASPPRRKIAPGPLPRASSSLMKTISAIPRMFAPGRNGPRSNPTPSPSAPMPPMRPRRRA